MERRSAYEELRQKIIVSTLSRRNLFHRKGIKLLSGIVLGVVIAGFLIQATAEAKEPTRIVIGGGDSFEPLMFLNADGEPDGMWVDLWQLWSEKTGVEVELRLMDWADTIPMLLKAEVDAVDGVTYTPERAKFLDLSSSYTELSSYIYFHESIGGVKELTDLSGFPVGVIGGSHVEDHLRTKAPKLRPVPYVSYEEIVQAAIQGRLRVFVGEDPIIPFLFAKMGHRITFRRTEAPIISSDMRTVVRKGNTELLALIERGHKAISPAELQGIRDEWAGVSMASQFPLQWVIGGVAILFAGIALLLLWNTQLKKRVVAATRTIREREERLRSFGNAIPDLAFMLDEDGRFLEILTANEELLYKDLSEVKNSYIHEILPGDVAELSMEMIQRTIATGNNQIFEYKLDFPTGERWFEARLSPILGISGDKQMVTCIARDITDSKKAEIDLKMEKERLQVLIEESPFGVSLIGEDGHYKYVNPKFTEIFGYSMEDIPTRDEWFRKAYPDREYRKQAVSTWINDKQVSATGEARSRTFIVKCKDGTKKDIHFRSVTLETEDQLVIYEDFTEKKLLEAQLFQAQKMEAVGTLAGGIAHDFNNLLMGIQGRTSLMLTDTDIPHNYIEHLKGIEEYVKSSTDLTKQLLGFARGGKYHVKPTNLNRVIEKSSEMFGRTKKEITIHTEYQKDLWSTEVDQGQIEQVLLNLYVNAWHAMPGGGDLYLCTENTTLDKDHVKCYGAKAGKYIKISVRDTGVGMDEATQLKLFDPFFTTREMGRGSGLGLASAYGIIKNHGGIIEVQSEKLKGSTFNIYLPASEKEVIIEAEIAENKLMGSESILLVDDEEMIIEVANQMLEKLGYKVLTARGTKEAIKLLNENKNTIAMVILDMIMPDYSGLKTYGMLKEINPEIKVLLSSGYSIDGQATEILDKGCNGFIQKPFSIKELSQKIREVLED